MKHLLGGDATSRGERDICPMSDKEMIIIHSVCYLLLVVGVS